MTFEKIIFSRDFELNQWSASKIQLFLSNTSVATFLEENSFQIDTGIAFYISKKNNFHVTLNWNNDLNLKFSCFCTSSLTPVVCMIWLQRFTVPKVAPINKGCHCFSKVWTKSIGVSQSLVITMVQNLLGHQRKSLTQFFHSWPSFETEGLF